MKSYTLLSLLASLAAATYDSPPSYPAPAAPAYKSPPPPPPAAPAYMSPPPPAAYSPPSMGGGMTHMVTVGGVKPNQSGPPTPMLSYNPECVQAEIGDIVRFQFMQANHTVTQSTFDQPCVKKSDGKDSGFMPNPSGKSGLTFDFKVESKDPVWMYCKQKNGTHCGKGMVFSINAAQSGAKTFSAFKQLAIKLNGTALQDSNIVKAPPPAQMASTVTVVADGKATPPAYMAPSSPAPASIVNGQGVTPDGGACACKCLCGTNSFPPGAAVMNMGGFPGQISS